eukprot:538737-Pyramimonas_sp.AAC.1
MNTCATRRNVRLIRWLAKASARPLDSLLAHHPVHRLNIATAVVSTVIITAITAMITIFPFTLSLIASVPDPPNRP